MGFAPSFTLCATCCVKLRWMSEVFNYINLSRFMTKPTKWHVRPAKTQISLDIHPSDQSSLPAWRKLGSLATHWAHSEAFHQTGQIPRMIWVFVGRIVILLFLSWGSSFISSFFGGGERWGGIMTHLFHCSRNHCYLKCKGKNHFKVSQNCLLDTPRTVMVKSRKLLSRIQRPYKMAKFVKQSLCPKYFFLAWHLFMHMLSISLLLMQSIRKL